MLDRSNPERMKVVNLVGNILGEGNLQGLVSQRMRLHISCWRAFRRGRRRINESLLTKLSHRTREGLMPWALTVEANSRVTAGEGQMIWVFTPKVRSYIFPTLMYIFLF